MDHAKAKQALIKLRQEEFIKAKPSEQIRMAIDDLIAVKANSNVTFNMNLWVHDVPDTGICYVCVAGAVMLNRFQLRNDEKMRWSIGFENDTIRKKPGIRPEEEAWHALNMVRIGHLDYAAQIWGCPWPDPYQVCTLETGDFHTHFDWCIEQLRFRAALFEAVGA